MGVVLRSVRNQMRLGLVDPQKSHRGTTLLG
jgi:hypothetical protein